MPRIIRSIRTVFRYFTRRPSLTPVFLYDKEADGYTAYFKEFPDVISQGKTKREAELNLTEDLVASLEMIKRQSQQVSGKQQLVRA